MRNLVMSYKQCAFMLIVCLITVVLMAVVDGTIASATVVSRGTCSVGTIERAGDRAGSFRNDLRSGDVVLTLLCDGKPYVTQQGDVIAGWYRKRTETLSCTWRANGVAECGAPLSAEAAK